MIKKIITLFSFSTHVHTNVIMLINGKMSILIGILTFISMMKPSSESLKARKIRFVLSERSLTTVQYLDWPSLKFQFFSKTDNISKIAIYKLYLK